MITKQVGQTNTLCLCGKNHGRIMESVDKGQSRFSVEAYCCGLVTIKLRSKTAAETEFARLRQVAYRDIVGAVEEQTKLRAVK